MDKKCHHVVHVTGPQSPLLVHVLSPKKISSICLSFLHSLTVTGLRESFVSMATAAASSAHLSFVFFLITQPHRQRFHLYRGLSLPAKPSIFPFSSSPASIPKPVVTRVQPKESETTYFTSVEESLFEDAPFVPPSPPDGFVPPPFFDDGPLETGTR